MMNERLAEQRRMQRERVEAKDESSHEHQEKPRLTG